MADNKCSFHSFYCDSDEHFGYRIATGVSSKKLCKLFMEDYAVFGN